MTILAPVAKMGDAALEELQPAVKEGRDLRYAVCDYTKSKEVLATLAERLGAEAKFDLVLHYAGAAPGQYRGVGEDGETVEMGWSINVLGTFAATVAILRAGLLRKGGRVVFVASDQAYKGSYAPDKPLWMEKEGYGAIKSYADAKLQVCTLPAHCLF